MVAEVGRDGEQGSGRGDERPGGGGGGDETTGWGSLDEGRGLSLGVGAYLSPYSLDFIIFLGPRSYTSDSFH